MTARNGATPKGLHLVVLASPDMDERDVVGVRAIAGHLERVDRLPGESIKSMLHRAAWMATGTGKLVARLRLRGEG